MTDQPTEQTLLCETTPVADGDRPSQLVIAEYQRCASADSLQVDMFGNAMPRHLAALIRAGFAARLQVMDFPDARGPKELQYDEEWLAVLRGTHHLLSLAHRAKPLPGAFFTSRSLESSCCCQRQPLEGSGGANLAWKLWMMHRLVRSQHMSYGVTLSPPDHSVTTPQLLHPNPCRHGRCTTWALGSEPGVCAAAAVAAGRRRHPAQLRANSPRL